MMYMLLWIAVIIQRLTEVMIAKRNEMWMKNRGGIVIHELLYKWIVTAHVLFLISLFFESYVRHQHSAPIPVIYLIFFLVLQGVRIWCLRSLGRYWNTKIVVLPGARLKKVGPYRFFKHPNYFVVGLEFIVLSLVFHAFLTAVLFPVIHAILMYVRIPEEEKALKIYDKVEYGR